MKDRSLAGRLDRLGGRRVADYGGYLLYEVPESAAQELIGHSSVEAVDEYRFVLLNGGPIDTETSSSAHPGRAAPESFDGKRLRIVQFVGPSRPEWVTALRDTGAELVSYIPHNAYLVYADAASMGALTELESSDHVIQWQAPYQRGHKVHPGAFRAAQLRALRRQRRSRSAAAQDEDLYAVQLVNDPAANAVTIGMVSAISSGAIRSQFRVRDYLNIIVPLELGDLDAVAARPDVVSIHPFAVPEKSGERQGQIMAFDLTGTTSGYLDFLAASGFTQQQFTASGFAVDISDSGIDNATTSPNHPGLYIGGNTSAASRVLYNRLEGSPIFGNTLEGCDGHGNINAHILAGYNDGFGFPFADADGFRFGLGVAPFVKVGSSVIFAPDYTYPDFPDLQSRAYADGARISSNSWGGLVYGAYDVTAQTFDALVRDAQPSGAAVASPGNQEMVIIVAAGNEGFEGLRSPATAKNVITVGASENIHFLGDADGCGLDDSAADNADDMADFSSRGPTEDGRIKPDLVAPGTHVSGGVYQSATPGATGEANACFDGSGNCGLATGFFFPAGQQFYTISSGTSHATPAVAASAALVRQFFINQGLVPPSPAMTKAFLMSSARYLTGAGANDTLWSNSQGMGAVNLGAAFDTPPRLLYDQRPEEMFTASGQNFTVTGTIAEPSRPFRVTLAWTDAPGSTTGPAFNNDLDLTVTVGGQVVRPPSLTVSVTTVAPGGSVQVSVAEGPGQRGDWVALAAVGSGLASYVDWNYLGGARSMPATGVTSAVLTFDMPETGAYEFRFFANNGYTLLATSPVVTVELPSIPVLEVVPASLSFGTVESDASADRSVTVRNAGAGTLVGEATAVGAGFSLVGNTSYALGADETALLTVRFAPVSAGAASGALSLTGAGGATVPLSGIGELPSTTPLLEVDPQTLSFGSVAPGSNADLSITVRNAGAGILAGEATVTGPGFLLVGVTNYSLGAGETTSLTVRFAPPAAGEAIGMLSLTGAGGATVPLSGTGTVGPTVAVSATSVALGGSVEVTVSNGPGNCGDSVSLAEVGSAANSYLDWQYLNGTRSIPATGQMSVELTFIMPLTPGEYELRFFMNSYNLLATSPVVTVKPLTLTVSATTVAPGGSVQLSVAEGPGQRGDWVALAAVGSGLASYVDWNYLSGARSMPATGVTSAVLTFDMPETGAYEFRFFANNGYTLLATSPVVTVELPSTLVSEVPAAESGP